METKAKKSIGKTVAREVAENFKAWFERNFVNRRAGRIGGVSYSRAGRFDDHTGDWTWYTDPYGRAYYDYTEPLTPDEEAFLVSHPLVLGQLVLGVTDLRGLRCLRRGLTMRTNRLQQKSYRSRYYARDNERRRMLAAERRKIRRRTTLNPCPTPDMLREAFSRTKESVEAKIRFGGMLHDLACYVDSCLRCDAEGNIVGRNAGIKGWLAENVPELHIRYKTVMRYKALAMRLRQASGVEDPVPTSALLDDGDGATGLAGGLGISDDNSFRTRFKHDIGRGEPNVGRDETQYKYYAQKSQNGRQRGCRERYERSMERRGEGRVWILKGVETLKSVETLKGVERGRRLAREVCAECRNTLADAFRHVDRLLEAVG